MSYEWMASGVYAIVNKGTGEQYVGCGRMFCLRWLRHVTNLDRGVHHNHRLQSAWNEYGKDAFDFIILEVVPDADANTDTLRARERAWIEDTQPAYNTLRHGPTLKEWIDTSLTPEQRTWATLREAREERNLSLTELAKKSGIDMSTLSRIEHGKRPPSAKTIHAVALALDCTPAALGWDKISARKTPSLQVWRIRRMMYQHELAEAAGVKHWVVVRAENGFPLRPEIIGKLATALNVTTDQLCQAAEEPAA